MMTGKKAHFIGICGKGMGAVAIMLQKEGWTISGSDQGFYDPIYTLLKDNGITFAGSHAKENIPTDVDMIVIGKHAKLIPETNEEVAEAFRRKVPILSFPQVLEQYTKDKDTIVVAGSFAKSTCTSIIAWCLMHAHKDPSYFIGALPFGFTETAHKGKSDVWVLEGDEYPSANWDLSSKFLFYHPHTVLLTSGEHDHLNIFPTLESYLEPYKKLVGQLDENDLVVSCKTGAHIEEILQKSKARNVTYSLDTSADWYAENIHYGETTTFDVMHNGEKVGVFSTKLLGSFNIENCVGCIALMLEKKLLTVEELHKGIETFQGVSGRLDRKPTHSSVMIFEGYGSSHAKLAPLFDALATHFPNKKVVAMFEPHTFSWRNKAALPWYDHVFDKARNVFVYEPPTHGAASHEQLTLSEIVTQIQKTHSSVFPFNSKEEGLELLKKHLHKDDIVLMITSGDLGGIMPLIPPLVEELFPNN